MIIKEQKAFKKFVNNTFNNISHVNLKFPDTYDIIINLFLKQISECFILIFI